MQIVVFNTDADSQGSTLIPVTESNRIILITYINSITLDLISSNIYPGGYNNMDLAMTLT